MNKPLYGLFLGGILGAVDGLFARVSAPELKSELAGIVIGSTFKGLIVGLLIGFFAKKVASLPWGIVFGGLTGLILAAPIAYLNSNAYQTNYYWHIMLPGAIVGLIVGYATQRYGGAKSEGDAEEAAA